jgi:hypothetical protein
MGLHSSRGAATMSKDELRVILALVSQVSHLEGLTLTWKDIQILKGIDVSKYRKELGIA